MQVLTQGSTPKTGQKAVLTSLSLLLSTGSALANAPGFATHSQMAPSAWQPSQPQNHTQLHSGSQANSPFGHPSFATSSFQQQLHPHVPQHVSSAQQAWQNFGMQPGSLAPLLTGNFEKPNQGYQLDLGSSVANVVLGSKIFNGAPSVTVDIGGQSVSFHPGSQVTAAEYVAVKEVLSGGQQSLLVNTGGTAAGGTFSLNQVVTPKVSGLVIPQTVTAIDYFASGKPVVLHGDLVNYGSIYGISTNSAVTSGSIFAHDITNEAGGLITTQVSSSMAASIANLISGTSLVLGAGNNLINSGTISGAGHLTLATVSGGITNNAGGNLSAVQNVNLISGSGNINNAGNVASATGNINMAALSANTALNINATGGNFNALNGAININDASYTGSADINLVGGNYNSQSLNINGGDGAIVGVVDDVTGTLNTSGLAAHFMADTKVLTLGNNCLKGDPTFANTGDININGAVTAMEDITIIAGGNIAETGPGPTSISTFNSTSSTSIPSTNITLIAGAGVITPTATGTLPGSGNPITAGQFVTVDFSKGTGGNISLGTTTIDASSSNLPGNPGTGSYVQVNGGNVTLVALANGSTGGSIATGAINTSSQNGNGGNVTAIAGDNTAGGKSIVLGPIQTGAGNSSTLPSLSGGNVSLYTQQPTGKVVYDSSGALVSGKIAPSGVTIATGQVKLSGVDTSGNSFDANTAGVGGNVNIVAGNVSMTSGKSINTTAIYSGNVRIDGINTIDLSGSSITTASNAVTFDGSGGNVTISGDTITVGAVTSGLSTGANLRAGNINLTSQSNLTTGTVSAATTGSGGLAGDVMLNARGILAVNGLATGSAVSGRNIVLSGLNGLSVTAPNGVKATDIAALGSVTVLAGAFNHPATINIAGGISTKGALNGTVQLINMSKTASGINLTVGGTIDTSDTSGFNDGGSVAVVSSGAIKLANIVTSSLIPFSGNGGSVFISSGSLDKVAITTGTINTSSNKTHFGSVAGTVIMITPGAKTAVNPTTIKHGAVTQSGSIKAQSLYASLSAVSTPDTIPTVLNITPTIVGASAINIRPGGYQSLQGASGAGNQISFTINNPNTSVIAPITLSQDTSGDSIFLGTITQHNGNDNINIAAGGRIHFAGDFTTSMGTRSLTIDSLAGVVADKTGSLNLNSNGPITLYSPTGISGFGQAVVQATRDVVINGTLDTSNAAGNGGLVYVSSFNGNITTSDIRTGGVGVGAIAGDVVLNASLGLNVGHIEASSRDLANNFNATGGGNVYLFAGNGGNGIVRVGNITNGGNGLVRLTAFGGAIIDSGDIVSPYNSLMPVTSVGLTSEIFIRTGNISTSAPGVAGSTNGSISLYSSQYGMLTGDIDTSSDGFHAGDVTLFARTFNGGGSIGVASINTSSSGAATSGHGGNVIITNTGGDVTWGEGGIIASGAFTGAATATGGQVVINTIGNAIGYGINTAVDTVGGVSTGGAVLINANGISVSSIKTGSSAASAQYAGGDVTLEASSYIDVPTVSTAAASAASSTGSIYEYSRGTVRNTLLSTASTNNAGSVTVLASSDVVGSKIDTSANSTTGADVTAGNVEIVSVGSTIVLSGLLDASAATTGTNAHGGSVGMTSGILFGTGISFLSMNASATAVTQAIAGDVFLSATAGLGQGIATSIVDTSATAGTTTVPGNIFALSGTNTVAVGTTGANTPALITATTGSSSDFELGGSFTIKVNTTAVNIAAGPYTSVGTSNNGVDLTLDFGGDARLLVPIVSAALFPGGGMYINSITGDYSVVDPNTAGSYGVHLINNGYPTGQRHTVIVGTIDSSLGGKGEVQIVDLQNSIDSVAGSINTNVTHLVSFGDIGSSSAPLSVVSAATTFNTIGVSNDFSVYIQPTDLADFAGTSNASRGGTVNIVDTTGSVSKITVSGTILASHINLDLSAGSGTTVQIDGSLLGTERDSNINVATDSLGSVSVGNVGRISAGDVLLQTQSVVNGGVINASYGTLAVTGENLQFSVGYYTSAQGLSFSSQGNLDISNLIDVSGSFKLSPGSNLLLVASGDVTATTAGNFDITTGRVGSNAGSVSILAGVDFNCPDGNNFNSLTVPDLSTPSATGGSIILDGSNGGNLTVNTSSKSGSAGNVIFIATSSAGVDGVIKLDPTKSIDASGVSFNGSVSLEATGPAVNTNAGIVVGSINVGGVGKADNNGNILVAVGVFNPQSITFNNATTFGAPGVGVGGSGTIQTGNLTTNRGLVFLQAPDGITANFQSNTLNANSLIISSTNGTFAVADTTNSLTVFPLVGDTSGGFLSFQPNKYTTVGAGPLVLTADAAAGSNGNGGFVSYSTSNSATVTLGNGAANLQMYARSGSAGGNGGTLQLSTDGDVVYDSQYFDASPKGANGGGGSYTINAAHVLHAGLGPLVMTANGVGTGNGGSISIELTPTVVVPITVDATTYSFSATSGPTGGNGGRVDFSVSGDLTVNPAQIKVNPLGKLGNGGFVRLEAGNSGVNSGQLLVTAPIVVSAKGTAKGGEIDLVSNFSNPFEIGGKTALITGPNGMVGVPVAAGKPNGKLVIINNGGGVDTLAAITAFDNIQLSGNGARIRVGGNLGSTATSKVLLTNTNGLIVTTTKTAVVTAKEITFDASDDIEGFGGAMFPVSTPLLSITGVVASVSDKISVVLDTVQTSKLFLLGSKDIKSDNIVNSPFIDITSNGIVAGATPGQFLNLNTSSLKVEGTGSFSLINNGSKTFIEDGSALKAKSLSLYSVGPITVTGAVGSSTAVVNLLTYNSGSDIISQNATTIITAKTFSATTLTNSGTGTSTDPLYLNAANVTLSSANGVNVLTSAPTTTLTKVAASNGSIDINTTGTKAKVIQTLGIVGKAAGGILSATSANDSHITLQNNNTTAGSIVIGKGTSISTSLTGAGNGNVTISIGTAGANAGSPPLGIKFNPAYTNSLYLFGKNGISVAGTSATPGKETISLNSIGGGKVIFDTGTLKSTAIKINGNTVAAPTTITADPPVISGAAAASNVLAATSDFTPVATTSTTSVMSHVSTPVAISAALPPVTVSQPAASAATVTPQLQSTVLQVAPQSQPLAGYAALNSGAIRSGAISSGANSSARELSWISETELTNGQVPAIVYSQQDLGLSADQTTVVELQKKAGDNHLQLNRGSVMFAPTTDTVIDTPLGSVSVAADCLVLVTVNGQGTAVYDLDDSRHNSVTVKRGNKVVPLAPGRHVFLTDKTDAQFADVNAVQMVGYRNIREERHDENVKAFTADFSMAHAVHVMQPIKQMFNCKSARSAKVSSHLLKTLSIMMSLDAGRGSYQQVVKPKLTAWAP